MALTKTIVPGEVSEDYNGAWKVPITLTILDDSAPVRTKTYAVQYRTGQDAENKVKALKVQMDAEIAEYAREANIEDSAALSNAISWLETNVVI